MSSAWKTRAWLKAFGIVIVLAGNCGRASASTYIVKSCGASSTLRSDAWQGTTGPGLTFEQADLCASANADSDYLADYTHSRYVRAAKNSSVNLFAPSGVAASISLTAPPTGELLSIQYRRVLESSAIDWDTQLVAGGEVKEHCIRTTGDKCGNDDTADVLQTYQLPAGSSSVALQIVCRPVFGGSRCSYGAGTYPDAAAVIYYSEVSVEEDGLPTAAAPTASGLIDGWVGPSSQVSFQGSDQLGLRSLSLGDGGGVAKSVAGVCVDWSVYPCSEASAGGSIGLSGTANAAQLNALGEGAHALRTTATDGAGNVKASDGAQTVLVDTVAPVAQNVTGGGLSVDQSRSLSWTVPGGGSPVVRARVQLCDGAAPSTGSCTWHDAPTAGPFAVDLAAPVGTVNARVELTDLVGNVALAPAVDFSRDAVAPIAPGLVLVATNGAKRRFAITTNDPSVTTALVRFCRNDACQDLGARSIGEQVEVTDAGPGGYRFEAALRDAAGNTGPYASSSFVIPPGPDPVQPPPPTVTPKSNELKATFPKRLSARSVLIRGTVVARSTSRITAKLSGVNAKGRRVSSTRSVKPTASGTWSLRAPLPARVRRAHGVLVVVTATPTAGFRAASAQKRVRG